MKNFFLKMNRLEIIIRKNLLLILIINSIIIGIMLGKLLKTADLDENTIMIIAYPGELFFRLLNLMIIPFVMSCVIYGMGSLDVKKNGCIAGVSFVYFFFTSLLNVILGVTLVELIRPGDTGTLHSKNNSDQVYTTVLDGFLDMGRNVIPDNIFEATFHQTNTKYVRLEYSTVDDKENSTFKRIVSTDRKGTNSLGLLFFSALFGSVLGTLPGDKTGVVNLFYTISQVIQRIIAGAIWLSPIAILSTILNEMLNFKETSKLFEELAWFVITVLIGLVIYHFLLVQLIYFAMTRKNPFSFYFKLKHPILIAFSASTKTPAMAESLRVLDSQGINAQVSRFIMSIGSVNMDGAALYIAACLTFMAEVKNHTLDIGEIISLVITVTLMSFALATVPGSALLMTMTLSALVRATPDDITLLFAVDWCLDRFRAANNLIGDLYGCAVVDHLLKKKFKKINCQEVMNSAYGSLNMENFKQFQADSISITITDEHQISTVF